MPALTALSVAPLSRGPAKLLMILCHGIHSNAGQLKPLVDAWSSILPSAAFALPNAPLRRRAHWLGPVLPQRREWFSIRDPSPEAYERGARHAAGLLDPFIDAELGRLGLPADAYALAGFSQGAMTALFAGLRRPTPPRAIICYAGALIGAETLEKELTHCPPVMIVHGCDDRIVGPAASKHAEKTLIQFGIPVTASFVSELGHKIDDKAIALCDSFLVQNLSV